MTANNFIREFAIKIFSEAARIEDELYYKVLNQDKNFNTEDFQDDYMLAWFLGEFGEKFLTKHIVEIIKDTPDDFRCIYLIEGRYVLETVIYNTDSYDNYDKLDWKFVEKKTKTIEVTEWTKI